MPTVIASSVVVAYCQKNRILKFRKVGFKLIFRQMLPKAERVRQSWVSGFLKLNLWLRDKLVIFIEAMGKVRTRHPDVSTL